ncbi:hypothetical protein UWK_02652 [Desulfocapsa sulfexigens DSM 10523]|uniref:Uncharacterized protein n=2 Tax=Desulfocapsa TaxID=53318 RepID=M1P6U7_DESSD|nr:hypothetical protein UWK_02652 [Desulfocapsa sulfexigens DSM 10523]
MNPKNIDLKSIRLIVQTPNNSLIIEMQRDKKMAKKNKSTGKTKTKTLVAEKNEEAMIEGILEGSPDGIGVVIVRLACGCKKMAAVAKDGEPASKLIIYRDQAESICDLCKKDDGDYMRVTEAFIHWSKPEPSDSQKEKINAKVLGTAPTVN